MDRFARALVRWRWVVLVVWAVIGAVAAVRAPATPALLNIRGGSARETEASRTEDLLTRRFSRPIGEFFAVTLQAPASFDEPAPRAALDTLLAALGRAALHPRPRLLPLHRRHHLPQPGPSRHVRDRGARGHARRQRGRAGAAGAGAGAGDPGAHARRRPLPGAGDRPRPARPRRAHGGDAGQRRRGEAAPAAHAGDPGARVRRAGGGGAAADRRACWRSPSRSRSSASSRTTRRCRCSCST